MFSKKEFAFVTNFLFISSETFMLNRAEHEKNIYNRGPHEEKGQNISSFVHTNSFEQTSITMCNV